VNSVELLVWRLVKGGAVVATSSGVLPIVADRAPLDMQLLDGQAEDGDGTGGIPRIVTVTKMESLGPRGIRRRIRVPCYLPGTFAEGTARTPRVPQRREPSQRSA